MTMRMEVWSTVWWKVAEPFVTGDDFDAFVAEFDAGAADADMNHDGFANGDDFDYFSQHFDAGC